MHRRDFLSLCSAAAAAGFAIDPRDAAAFSLPQPQAKPGDAPPAPSPAAPQSPAAPPWPAPFDSAPVLQNPAPDAMTVIVAVRAITTAWVEYGTSSDKLDQRADDSSHGLLPLNGRVHRIRLTGLRPGTRYHYRVVAAAIDFKNAYKIGRAEPVPGPTYSFTTLDSRAAREATFAVINDTHENPTTLAGLTAQLAAKPADMTFWNGDIFNDVRSDDQIVDQVMRPAAAAYASSTPMCFVSGNHDVRGIHARSLDRFLDVPGDRRYHLLRHGPLAVVVLDTGEDKPDDHPVYAGLNDFARYRATQRDWLQQTLRSDDWRSASFRVAMLHIPLWGKAASEDSRAKWHKLLNDARTDLVINGHVHEHLFMPRNTDHAYAQLVGGGPAPETATLIRVHAERRSMAAIVHDLSGKELANHEFKA